MSTFDSERLTVEYRDGISTSEPIISRCHTLTHSDLTGELFLTIGTRFAWDQVNMDLRDEVLGIWSMEADRLWYNIYVLLNKEKHDLNTAIRRQEIFRRELPLALTTIRYGDRFLFDHYPSLDKEFIIVNMVSSYPQLMKQESWGRFGSYAI